MNDSMKAQLKQIMESVTWHITEQNPNGTVIIEARYWGKPVYRYIGQYLPSTGEWGLYSKGNGIGLVKKGFEPLCYVSRISIYDCKRDGCVGPPD